MHVLRVSGLFAETVIDFGDALLLTFGMFGFSFIIAGLIILIMIMREFWRIIKDD